MLTCVCGNSSEDCTGTPLDAFSGVNAVFDGGEIALEDLQGRGARSYYAILGDAAEFARVHGRDFAI